MSSSRRFAATAAIALLVVFPVRSPGAGVKPCRIEVVDKANGWPVPMVELRAIHKAFLEYFRTKTPQILRPASGHEPKGDR